MSADGKAALEACENRRPAVVPLVSRRTNRCGKQSEIGCFAPITLSFMDFCSDDREFDLGSIKVLQST